MVSRTLLFCVLVSSIAFVAAKTLESPPQVKEIIVENQENELTVDNAPEETVSDADISEEHPDSSGLSIVDKVKKGYKSTINKTKSLFGFDRKHNKPNKGPVFRTKPRLPVRGSARLCKHGRCNDKEPNYWKQLGGDLTREGAMIATKGLAEAIVQHVSQKLNGDGGKDCTENALLHCKQEQSERVKELDDLISYKELELFRDCMTLYTRENC